MESIFEKLSPYLVFIKKSFNREKAYKFEYMLGIFNGLLFIFVFTSLWENIYSTVNIADNPFSKSGIISYAIYAMLIRISMTQEESSIPASVRTGQIAIDLIKPINFIAVHFSQSLGQTMFHWVTRVIPITIVVILFFDYGLDLDTFRLLVFFLSWCSGYLILFFINFVFAILSFWFIENFSFQLMKFGLMTLFSGGILPIDFFPDYMQNLVSLLPFKYIIYVPTSIFISHKSIDESIYLVFLQLLWVLATFLLAWISFRSAEKHLVVQGG